MPTFQFEAMDATGQEIRDVIDAENQEEAQATKAVKCTTGKRTVGFMPGSSPVIIDSAAANARNAGTETSRLEAL